MKKAMPMAETKLKVGDYVRFTIAAIVANPQSRLWAHRQRMFISRLDMRWPTEDDHRLGKPQVLYALCLRPEQEPHSTMLLPAADLELAPAAHYDEPTVMPRLLSRQRSRMIAKGLNIDL